MRPGSLGRQLRARRFSQESNDDQLKDGITSKTVTIVIASTNPEIGEISGLPSKKFRFQRFSSGNEAYEWCLTHKGEFSFCVIGDLNDMTGKTLCYRIRRDIPTRTLLFLEENEDPVRVCNYTHADVLLPWNESALDIIRNYAKTGTVAQQPREKIVPKFKQVSRLVKGAIIKDYTLIDLIAVGGMSTVWEARKNGSKFPAVCNQVSECRLET